MNKNEEDLKMIFTISRTIYPKYHPFWFIFYMYVWYTRTVKRKLKYSVRAVSIDFIEKMVNDVNFKDVNNTVVVHPENIYMNDKVLQLCSDDKKTSSTVYIISNSICNTNELLVSETFYYNLLNLNLLDNVRLLNYKNYYINFADEINISLINSPDDINNSISDALLDRYFKSPKILRKGDLIEIDLKYVAEDIFYLNCKLNNVHSVFFKCNKILYNGIEQTENFYCVIGETAIRQSSNIQSFLPNRKIKCIYEDNKYLKLSPIVPYGLQEYFEEMQLAVKPFLNGAKLPLQPIFLVVGKTGSGKELLVTAVASHFGMHYCKIDNINLVANVYAQNETKLHNAFFNAKMAAPCIISIHNFENFGKNNDGQYDERIIGHFADELEFLFEKNPYPVLLFCCTNQSTIPSDLQKLFLETFTVSAPTDIQRQQNLNWIIEQQKLNTRVNLAEIANRTHGFYFDDLVALVYYAQQNSQKKSSEIKQNFLKNSLEIELDENNFFDAVDYMQKNYNESVGAPKVPKVLWSDVGGLADVKEEIIKTINLPLKHPELLKKSGLKRSGILLFGPPGTGKTLIAKAVATECNLCFLSVKGPELLNMYVGQSEQNIREVFERAREASPCIIFFDELDSLAPNRGLSGDSGGVMDRVVSQLLAEMDGLNESSTIFIIGATNRPDLIDPALLRPGRFDKMLYIGPCTDFKSKTSVLKALTRKFKLSQDVNIEEIVKECPKNITGADFYGICSNAWLSAVRRLIKDIENGKCSSDEVSSDNVIVSFIDFKNAIQYVKPSISEQDLVYFEKLKLELSSNY